MQQGQLTCHFYYCLWFRPPKGKFARPHAGVGLGHLALPCGSGSVPSQGGLLSLS